MRHLALYRKYRPLTFADVIDQDHITSTLISQVKNNEVNHAYLFTGTRGTGKTTCAKIFAKAINCLNPVDGSPCLKCDVCKAYEGFNMDVVELDAASNTSVDNIRDIIENTKFLPVNGRYKVFIIDEVHMLSINAFNALLKTLEEPPEHVVFILATTEVHKIPATILSRVMRFDFHLVSVDGIVKLINKIFELEGIKADKESVLAIAKAGEGSVRDALSIADCVAAYSYKDITYNDVLNALGSSDKKMLVDLANAIIKGDIGSLFNLTDSIYKGGKNISIIVKDLTLHFRDLLIIKNCENANKLLSLPQDIYSEFVRQAESADGKFLLKCLQKFSSIENELRYALSPKVLLEITALECLRLGQKEFSTAITSNREVSTKQIEEEEVYTEQEVYASPQFDSKIEDKSVARKLWGQVLTSLREKGNMFLFTLCSDVTNIAVENGKFIVRANDLNTFDNLKKSEQELDTIIKNETELSLEIQKNSLLTKIDKNIEILKQYCGNILIVK